MASFYGHDLYVSRFCATTGLWVTFTVIAPLRKSECLPKPYQTSVKYGSVFLNRIFCSIQTETIIICVKWFTKSNV